MYLPHGIGIEIAKDTPLTEPEFFILRFQRDRSGFAQEPVDHRLPLGDITTLRLGTPAGAPESPAAVWAHSAGLLNCEQDDGYVLHVEFDVARHGASVGLQPDLPLVFRW